MRYTQLNSLPIPPSGPSDDVSSTFDTIFDWRYSLEQQNLLNLYEKGKTATWNANELDWSQEVNIEKLMLQRAQGVPLGDVMNALFKPPRKLDTKEVVAFNTNLNAFMLSQFLHGEQGALVATAKIVQAVPTEEAKWYAANQVADEARHVEVYHRYLTEKLGVSYEVNHHLQTLLRDIIADSRWDMTFLGMQIIVEGLALAAFGMMRFLMPGEPLINELTSRVMSDESRHVAFGVLALEDVYKNGLTAAELKEREDFVIHAVHLMRNRLLAEQVFARMGLDVKVWVEWSLTTPFMRGFRQMLFSKIVPNLKRLGLLTPRVREEFAKLDLLRYENEKDSTEEAIAAPPEELIRFITGSAQEFMAGQQA